MPGLIAQFVGEIADLIDLERHAREHFRVFVPDSYAERFEGGILPLHGRFILLAMALRENGKTRLAAPPALSIPAVNDGASRATG